MRILFSFVGGHGHFEPLVPIARAAMERGHDVLFTGQARLVPAVRAAGFPAVSSGGDPSPPPRLPLLPLDGIREERVLKDGYAGTIARRHLQHLSALAREFQPDVLVCDELDFGAMLAAETLHLPYASVVVIGAGTLVRASLVSEPLNALRAENGLPEDPAFTLWSRYLVLSPFPPSYRAPEMPLPVTGHYFRSITGERPTPDLAAWNARVRGAPGAPLVYFTLGTVFNVESGDLFARVVAGLCELSIELVVTVGSDIDPAELGELPSNVHVARYIPQTALLPECALVVSHGGSGSVLGALAHGVPMVILPVGADQPHNAARCQALGVARTLDAISATPAIVRDAAHAVLEEPSYRAAAARLRRAIAELPPPDYALDLVERLARERIPLSRTD